MEQFQYSEKIQHKIRIEIYTRYRSSISHVFMHVVSTFPHLFSDDVKRKMYVRMKSSTKSTVIKDVKKI